MLNPAQPQPVRAAKQKPNEPCSCGSGKKYKKCCGQNPVVAAPAPAGPARAAAARAVPPQIQSLFLAATQHHQAGRLAEADAGYRRVLQAFPAHAGAWMNLGALLRRAGQQDQAIACYQRALEIAPNDPLALNNLGNALLDKKQYEAAVANFQAALRLKPDYAQAHSNLALALRRLNRADASILHCRKALELTPDYPDAHNNLGAAFNEKSQYRDAEVHLRRALELQPGFGDAHTNLAITLQNLDRMDEARLHYREAIRLKPNDPEVHTNLGAFLHLMGDLKGAERCYQDALRLSPGDPLASVGLLQNKKATVEDLPTLQVLENALRNPEQRPETRMNMLYGLGKAYDDLKRYDQAFPYFVQANALRRQLRPAAFDKARHQHRVSEIMAVYNAEFFARQRPLGSDSELPVFIIGMMRSGTTLTEQILSSHPRAAGAGELVFWKEQAQKLGRMPAEQAAALDAATVADIAAASVSHLRGFSSEAVRITDKMPHNFLLAGLIHAVFPKARIIHTRRHPVDTALSIYFQNFQADHAFSESLEDIVFFTRQYQQLMEHWRRVLPPSVFLEIQYEELVADQEAVSRRMIEFCGLEWDDACLQFHKAERAVKTASSWQVRQPMYQSSAARWKNYERYLGPLAELLQP